MQKLIFSFLFSLFSFFCLAQTVNFGDAPTAALVNGSNGISAPLDLSGYATTADLSTYATTATVDAMRPAVYSFPNVVTSTTTAGEELFNVDHNFAEAGNYLLIVSGLANGDATGSDFIIEATFDGGNFDTQGIQVMRLESKDVAPSAVNADNYFTGSLQKNNLNVRQIKTVTAGTHNITFKIRPEAGGVEASAWSLVLTILKIDP